MMDNTGKGLDRRNFIARLGGFGALALLAEGAAFADVSAGKRLPNIVLVMADDQGWGDMGYYNRQRVETPNLDAMEREALRFDRFYSAGPVCSPTRASVMTGRHPNRCNVLNHGHSIRPQELTVPRQLKKAGYTSGHFGKWHIGSVQRASPTSPGAIGFDQWLSSPNFFDRNPLMSREGKVVECRGESEDITVDAAIDFIREQSREDSPFLAVVWFGNPHRPFQSLPKYKEKYKNGRFKGYLAEITAMDKAFGRLRKEIAKLGIRDNTLLWYTSDNGGLDPASSGGRGKKGVVYEGGLRVPAMIEWPAVVRSARSTDICCSTSDIYPTLLDIAEINPPQSLPLDGVSLLPLIEGGTIDHHPIGFWDMKVKGQPTFSDKILKKIRAADNLDELVATGKEGADAAKIARTWPVAQRGHAAWLDWPWKLHRIGGGKNARMELYNLEQDPSESKNLHDSHKKKSEQMLTALSKWQESVIESLNGEDYE